MTLSSWYGSTGAINSTVRAERTWSMILREPTEIIINRDGTDRDVQTVKLTFNTDPKWVGGDTDVGKSGNRDAVIFGVAGHQCETDTDLQTGDRFAIGLTRYEIRDVVTMPGGIQARCEQMQG